MILYDIILYYIILYYIILYYIILYCIILYCIVLYCIVLYCIVLYIMLYMYVIIVQYIMSIYTYYVCYIILLYVICGYNPTKKALEEQLMFMGVRQRSGATIGVPNSKSLRILDWSRNPSPQGLAGFHWVPGMRLLHLEPPPLHVGSRFLHLGQPILHVRRIVSELLEEHANRSV